MKRLSPQEVKKILEQFDVSQELELSSINQIEPDCVLYQLIDPLGDRYGLLCRDYFSDDKSIDERILASEHEISVLEWLTSASQPHKYYISSPDFDTYDYEFALFRY